MNQDEKQQSTTLVASKSNIDAGRRLVLKGRHIIRKCVGIFRSSNFGSDKGSAAL